MTNPAICFENLGFSYAPGQWILRGFNGQVETGKVFAILGPNGRGKTTLLKLLIGALTAVEGHVHTTGKVSFVPQLFQVSFPYTVLDMVLMGRAHKIGFFSTPNRQDEDIALQALERLGLADLAGRSFEELSGGQRQLVIFARALAAEADIIILDEPTSALDLKNQGVILEWIEKLSGEENLTIAFTTHHPHHACAVADTALLMMGAQQYLCGPAQQVMTEENLYALYGVDLKCLRFEHRGRTIETFVPVYEFRKWAEKS